MAIRSKSYNLHSTHITSRDFSCSLLIKGGVLFAHVIIHEKT